MKPKNEPKILTKIAVVFVCLVIGTNLFLALVGIGTEVSAESFLASQGYTEIELGDFIPDGCMPHHEIRYAFTAIHPHLGVRILGEVCRDALGDWLSAGKLE